MEGEGPKRVRYKNCSRNGYRETEAISRNRKGGHQYRRFDRYYDVLPGGQSAGGYMDNGFPGIDLYEAREQYYGLKEHVENYKAEGWGPVRRDE